MKGQVSEFQGAWQEESTGQMEPYMTKEAAGPSWDTVNAESNMKDYLVNSEDIPRWAG